MKNKRRTQYFRVSRLSQEPDSLCDKLKLLIEQNICVGNAEINVDTFGLHGLFRIPYSRKLFELDVNEFDFHIDI